MEYYSAHKKKEILTFAMTCNDICNEGSMLSEKIGQKKTNEYDHAYACGIKKKKKS